ncbi:hypothetical protein DAPPUDRAFT_307280 [Daphnia pulex]|uniref:PXA domain-containing protein n=1 Tax=Daphnia pulex TaxID=6669 RepID=E9H1K1_DAPPU|nr:hypothetical protein DAPPUDRAFT_307280 [Daphnia pulex]|eukprot:EFX74491.1 hypothetical protein DAPPUDRAFT_307280 [Daphnia pulex]
MKVKETRPVNRQTDFFSTSIKADSLLFDTLRNSSRCLLALCVLVLASVLAHQSIYRLIKSSSLWDCFKSGNSALHSCELSIKDVCDYELNSLAKNAAESVINYWCDNSNNNEEFQKEIHSQIEDIFFSLSQKLSKIKVEYFIKNLVLIVHNHLRSYKKTVNFGINNAHGSHSKFSFNHPVSRGEISLELYLDSLSHAVMKEFIPGSIQDCSAVFDFCCAAFCSHVLVKLVDHLSSPGLVLQALVQILESAQENTTRHESTDSDSFGTCENSIQEIPNISESTEDPLSGSSPRMQRNEEETGNIDNTENPFPCSRKSASPVLAGSNLLCNSLTSSTHQVSKSSWVQSGLSNSLSTATAPVLPSRFVRSREDEEEDKKKMCKPSSLPLIGTTGDNGDVIGSLDSEPMGAFSVDADVSPVYEDVEDFATAIAKLRSLLEQRVSSNGLDVPCGKNNVLSPTSDARAYTSGVETDNNYEELTEASELPNDSRIFFNVKIPKTEISTIPGEGQHSFYCIVYDGIYTAISASLANNMDDSQKNTRLVLKCRNVRRRFRQFMELHAQLEGSEDPSISQAVRSIRGPSKWLNLPFSFFAKTVSDVLQSIKTALPLPIPLFDNDQSRRMQLLPLPLPASPLTAPFEPPAAEREEKSSQSTSSIDEADGIPVTCRITYSSEESRLEMLMTNWNHMDCRIESAYEAFESHLWRSELNIQLSQESAVTDAKLQPNLETTTKFVDEPVKVGWNRFDDQLPLSSSVINLLVECLNLRDTWLTKAPVPLALKIVIGKQIESFFQESLLQFSNPNVLADNLRSLRQTFFVDDLDVTLSEEKDVNQLAQEVVHLLNKQLHGLLVKIVGEDLCTDVLKTTISCLTDPLLNRDLALTLLDFVFLQICSTPSLNDRFSVSI